MAGPSLPKRRLLFRLAGVLLPLALGLGGVEIWARQAHLDHRQGQAIALQGEPLQDFVEGDLASEEWRIAYLPQGFDSDQRGFATRWGACAYDHPGRTVLVFGDSTTVQATPGHEPHGTWPLQLQLPEDVQLCVMAEMGYHPGEYRLLAEVLADKGLEPDLTLVLLCENDLKDLQSRIGIEVDGHAALYEPPNHQLAFAPLWNPWLFERSEAFRFLHWRLAAARPAQQARIPAPIEPLRKALPSLQALQAMGPTELFYITPLRPGDQPNRHLIWLSEQLPELRVLDWATDPTGFRRQHDDPIHPNDQGHARIAEQVQPVLDAALAQDTP